jgi:predicted RNase H-like nuclease
VAEIYGVDGCRSGWVAVDDTTAVVVPTFTDVLEHAGADALVGVDMPIGLLDTWRPRGRDCDQLARSALGRHHARVFSAPCRAAFGAATLPEVQARGCRMTLQALNIMGKVAELDALVDAAVQRRVLEVHPELSFAALNGGSPVATSKKRARGRSERRALLSDHGIVVPERPRSGEAEDDVLDACAARWTVQRFMTGHARRLPEDPPVDARDLRMEIWY